MTAPAGNDNGGNDGGGEGGGRETNSGTDNFAAITSQEQFDKAFNQRWAREQSKIDERYAGFDDIKAKAEKFDELEAKNQTEAQRLQAERESALQKAAESDARADKAEKAALRQRVAIEEGLPPKFASRLTGDTEDELRADAKDTFGEYITTPSFDHGPRSKSAEPTMNDLIFNASRRR